MQSTGDEPITDPNHEEVERPSKRRRVNGLEGLSRELGLMRDGVGSSSTTFVGSASGIHFIRSVYGAIGSPTATNTSPEANLVPGEDDQLIAAAKPIWHENEVIAPSQLSFDALVSLTESYFDLWHPAFPFLHAPRVLDRLEQISRDGALQHWDLVIVKSIMSIALADRRQLGGVNQPVPSDLLFHTFDDALQDVNIALSKPATLTALQAVISVQLFLISMLRLNVACRLGGLIVQMAYQLGLHRCPSRYPSFTTEERELRKRIWWSAYMLERYTCQALGLPLLIHDDDVDVCMLNQENHRSCEASYAIDERMHLLDILAKHARLRGLIVELRNKSVTERDRSPETALHISAQLGRWWNEAEDITDGNESISAFHRAVLRTLNHESAIMLNRPLLALPKDTASYASAIEICISAAKSLLSTMGALQSTMPGIALVWPSFTWTAWMSAFILMFAVAEERVPFTTANKHIDKSLKILNTLATRESVWPKACAVAIEDIRRTWMHRVSAFLLTDSHPLHRSGAHAAADNPQQPTPHQVRQNPDQLHRPSHLDYHPVNPVEPTELHYATIGGSIPIPSNDFHNNDLDWLNSNMFRSDTQPIFDHTDPLQSFDIPFWLGADNTLAWMSNNT